MDVHIVQGQAGEVLDAGFQAIGKPGLIPFLHWGGVASLSRMADDSLHIPVPALPLQLQQCGAGPRELSAAGPVQRRRLRLGGWRAARAWGDPA